jgi:deazaflavin-dependent oxidoreductase (nitroreductase family)
MAYDNSPTKTFHSYVVGVLDIASVADEKYIYLTTTGRRTGRLHTVELWFAVAQGNLYLSHEGKYTDWMKNILNNNRVTFTIRRLNWEGTARIVGGGDTFETGKYALYHKYYGEARKEVIDDWFSESTVIEILVDTA